MSTNDDELFRRQAASVTDYADLHARGYEFTARFQATYPSVFATLAARRDAETRNPRPRGPRAA